MMLTDYHAKYFAHELTKRCPSDSPEKLAGALVDAQVDLNPHQVEAALFAFRSPLSRGALLADEVGLGKTIEAGLVISQRWAERKRRILVITPSNLRKQWHQELSEKFFLPCRILESRFYNEAVEQGNFRPFEGSDTIVICSYQFARSKAADVANTPWHLVVIDEAHRAVVDERRAEIERVISERNGKYFEAEAEKLDSWADDLKVALEREIKEMDRQIREARRKASQAASLETKLAGQKQIKALEAQRTSKRRSLFDAQDQIDQRREVLIQGIEAKLAPKAHLEPLMAIRWALR